MGLRLLAQLHARGTPPVKCLVLGRHNEIVKAQYPNNQDIRCLSIDLDHRKSLFGAKRAAKLAPWVVYLAPPPATGSDDPRMKHFIAASAAISSATTSYRATSAASFRRLQRCVYVSTTGVYGTAQGAWVRETSPIKPTEARGVRRVAAENRLKRSAFASVSVLRAPGIYAADRLPIERIQKGLPAFSPADDVPTNHIHADDLARLCWLALFKGRNRRAYNAADGEPMMHAEYLERVATCFNLPFPPRIGAEQAQAALTPMAWSMLSGARRVSSARIFREWGIKLKYPNMTQFLDTVQIETKSETDRELVR